MKFSLLLASLSSAFYFASANQFESFQLVKRDHGLPYSTLPTTSCAVPSSCSNIGTNVTCRCNDQITVCLNSNNQYCWGSQTLTSTSCPTVPTSCSSTLTGTNTTCLCNSNNVLCVDNANNYCYGSVSSGSVSLASLPTGASTSSSASAAASSVAVTSAGASTINAPSNAATATSATTSSTSGSSQISVTSMLTLACVIVAYVATN
ncbi:hypothetical protein G6F37_009821 [Rhizopus arrhizus]|nr:hypothetical protein G6F38_007526 [Rhizopus arrhizus]KAG1154033.1 hypothetical protein G6F37_009821 [Rhizopus arrhizus]